MRESWAILLSIVVYKVAGDIKKLFSGYSALETRVGYLKHRENLGPSYWSDCNQQELKCAYCHFIARWVKLAYLVKDNLIKVE